MRLVAASPQVGSRLLLRQGRQGLLILQHFAASHRICCPSCLPNRCSAAGLSGSALSSSAGAQLPRQHLHATGDLRSRGTLHGLAPHVSAPLLLPLLLRLLGRLGRRCL